MIELVRTMKDIEKKDWNSLVGKDKVETSYEWVSFAEDINIEPGHNYCHAVCEEKGKIVGILPAYYHNVYVRKPPQVSRLYALRKIVPRAKTPFKMTRVHIPLSCDSRYFGDKKYFNECLAEIENFSREKNHFLLRIDDSNEKMNIPGFFCIEVSPEVYTESYPSWDGYIQSQRGKRGKNIRYEYKKSVDMGTKTYLVEELDAYYDLLYNMYISVYTKNNGSVTYPRDYFKRMDECLYKYTKCIFAEDNGTITGYLLLVENDWFISCKYAGRDYKARDPYVYFRLLYELIKYSIKKKKPVSAEKATYDAKLRRGFKVIEKRNYLKVNWPFLEDLYVAVLKRVNKAKAENIKRVKSLQ